MWKNIAILKQNYTVKLLLFHLNENLDFLDFLQKNLSIEYSGTRIGKI